MKRERGDAGEESGERAERAWRNGKWECMITIAQNATYLAFADAPGYRPVSCIFRKLFHAQHLPRR